MPKSNGLQRWYKGKIWMEFDGNAYIRFAPRRGRVLQATERTVKIATTPGIWEKIIVPYLKTGDAPKEVKFSGYLDFDPTSLDGNEVVFFVNYLRYLGNPPSKEI